MHVWTLVRSPDGIGGLQAAVLRRTPMLCIGYGEIRESRPRTQPRISLRFIRATGRVQTCVIASVLCPARGKPVSLSLISPEATVVRVDR
jgi:hypothetical protein